MANDSQIVEEDNKNTLLIPLKPATIIETNTDEFMNSKTDLCKNQVAKPT